MITAYCWASGEIEFAKGANVPNAALPICAGPAKDVRALIAVSARHAYDNKTLLVPGIPEAPNQRKAGDALRTFCDWLKSRQYKSITVY